MLTSARPVISNIVYACVATLLLGTVMVVWTRTLNTPSTGYPVDLYASCHLPIQPSPALSPVTSNRLIFMQHASDGSVKINDTVVERGELRRLMREIMSTRAERFLFVYADENSRYSDVIRLVDDLQNCIPGIRLVLLTRKSLNECFPGIRT
jgi:biopolymer transport protein ExbD